MKSKQEPLKKEELLRRAYFTWLHFYPFEHADFRIQELLTLNNLRAITFGKSLPWLRMTRESLFLTMESVAKRLNITAPTYAKLEQSEAQGTISIGKLSEVADAMDCELILALKPRNGRVFSRSVWDSAIDETFQKYELSPERAQKGPVVLARMVRTQMLNLKSRKRRGWNQKAMNLDFKFD